MNSLARRLLAQRSPWSTIAKGQRLLGLTLVGALLSACGGGPGEDESSSSMSSSSSSSISSSTSSSSSSTSSSQGGTQFSDFTANVSMGETQYQAQCVFCHGDEGKGGNGLQPINLGNYPSSQSLYQVIDISMPKKTGTSIDPSQCVGQCAADITAYLETFKVVAASCDAENPVIYSEREIKLLTKLEYANSVQDLFPSAEVPAEYLDSIDDITVGRFPNHNETAVISARGRKFMSNAEGIADWAIANGQFDNCDNANSCASQFVNDFAFRAFRRPLRTGPSAEENEVAQYEELFSQAPSVSAGLRWAIIATLTSPNFLYRSELGIPVSEAIDNPLFSSAGDGTVVGDLADYEAIPGGETVNGTQFTIMPGNNGEPRERAGVQTHLLWTNGSASRSFNFSSPAILSVNLGGRDQNNTWPMVSISVGGQLIAAETVNTTDYGMRTYQYLVSGMTGNQTVEITFSNDANDGNDGQDGHDIDVFVGDVTVSAARMKGAGGQEEEQSSLELADPNAYVLDPYEYASALSYFLVGSTPDMTLLQAASSGALNTKEGVQEQIARLLETDAAERHIKQFVMTWMRVERMYESNFLRNAEGFNDNIRDAMIEELKAFFWYIFDNEEVPFEEFYTADYTFLNQALANFYGLNRGNGVTDSNGFVLSDAPMRGGITTMGAFLTTWAHPDETAPILRAVNVREQMLCHHIDPPPKTDIDAEARQAQTEKVNKLQEEGMMTTYAYYNAITEHQACANCHQEDINPLGKGLENFDNVGRFRTNQVERGGTEIINITWDGTLFGIENYKAYEEQQAFNGGKDLGDLLGSTNAVQACLAEKAFRLALNRPIKNTAKDKLTNEHELSENEIHDYACAQEKLVDSLEASNQSPKALFKTLGGLDLIRFRR